LAAARCHFWCGNWAVGEIIWRSGWYFFFLNGTNTTLRMYCKTIFLFFWKKMYHTEFLNWFINLNREISFFWNRNERFITRVHLGYRVPKGTIIIYTLDVLYWAMHPALYRRIRMAIEIASNLPALFCCCRFVVAH
jgi:hypothetical protein